MLVASSKLEPLVERVAGPATRRLATTCSCVELEYAAAYDTSKEPHAADLTMRMHMHLRACGRGVQGSPGFTSLPLQVWRPLTGSARRLRRHRRLRCRPRPEACLW